jgi:hypothetical protein
MGWAENRRGNGSGSISVVRGDDTPPEAPSAPTPDDPMAHLAKRIGSLQTLILAAVALLLAGGATAARLGCAATTDDVATAVRAHAEAPAHAGILPRLEILERRCERLDEGLRGIAASQQWIQQALWDHVRGAAISVQTPPGASVGP